MRQPNVLETKLKKVFCANKRRKYVLKDLHLKIIQTELVKAHHERRKNGVKPLLNSIYFKVLSRQQYHLQCSKTVSF